jgi:chitinase
VFRVSYDDSETYQLKQNFANSLCLGGTFVWALDLDDSSTGQSSDNLALGGLAAFGDPVDSNPLYARHKLSATDEQNSVSLLTFWTDCSPNPSCPDGFKMLTTGHGKVCLQMLSFVKCVSSRFKTWTSKTDLLVGL